EPTGRRSYFGGVSEANAARTVLRDTFITRAIILIGNPSARCNRRISAQSSTDNTPCLPPTLIKARRSRKGSKFGRRHGVSFQAARTPKRNVTTFAGRKPLARNDGSPSRVPV